MMGLPIVAVAKLHLQLTCHGLSSGGWACPLALKLLLGLRIVREAYSEAVYGSRLFFFRLGQIAFNGEPLDNRARLERAYRLIRQTIFTNPRRLQDAELPQETLQAFSMLAL